MLHSYSPPSFEQRTEIIRIIFLNEVYFTGRRRRRKEHMEADNTIHEVCCRILILSELYTSAKDKTTRCKAVQPYIRAVNNRCYETFIGRVPVFLLGIMCYKDRTFFKYGLAIFTVFLIPALLLYMRGLVHTYTLMYCLGPIIILAVAYVVPICQKNENLCKALSWMGGKSLEIYVANCIVCIVLGASISGWEMTAAYWLLHIPIVLIVCWLNNVFAKVLNRSNN